MTREQAINYLYCSGFSEEQVSEVVRALTYEPTTKNEVKYCDRNICLKNEYNNIGCEDCEVTKSQEPTTKNNLGVDYISRADAIKAMQDKAKKLKNEDTINGLCGAVAILFDLPSVTPQEPTIKALGEELRKARKGIADEKVLIGYNMAVAICNKHLGEREVSEET